MSKGECLRVIATDPAAFIDIPVYCQMSDNKLIDSSKAQNKLIFIIEKNRSWVLGTVLVNQPLFSINP